MSVADSVLGNVKYPPETLLESRLTNIPGNQTDFYWNITDCKDYLLWMRGLSINRNASIRAFIRGQVGDRNIEDTITFGAAVPNFEDETSINIPFDLTARLELLNVTGVAVNNYQARVRWEVTRYTIIDKILQGVALNDEELAIVTKYELDRKIAAGILPMPYPKGPLVEEYTGNWAGAPVANVENTLVERAVPEGYKIILTKVWGTQPVANFGNLEIRVYRERTLYQTLFPYCFPNYTTATRCIPPVELWIPSRQHIRVALTSTIGHAANFAQATLEIRKLTIWDKLNWGLRLTNQEQNMVDELDLRTKLQAGLYEYITPISKWVG